MKRLALSLPIMCITLAAQPVMAGEAGRALQPTTQQAQQMLDRLAQEPLKYEGDSATAPGFRQAPGYTGRQPTRILVGYHIEGNRLQGEFVALDADNRPLQAAPLTGALTAQDVTQAHYQPASGFSGPVPCTIDIALPKPLHLDGQCASAMISGAYAEKVNPSPLVFILPGLAASEARSGQYMMQPWRG